MADPETQKVISDFISTFYKNILKSSRVKENPLKYLEIRLSSLESYWNDFYKNHLQIAVDEDYAETPYITENHYEIAEEEYIATKAAICREIEKLRPDPKIASTDIENQKLKVEGSIVPDNPFKHLPALSLPQFSGNQLEWETFRDMFTAMVHKTTLSNVQKLYYLKSSLSGKAAERLKNMMINDANYTDAWKKLMSRYDNKRILLATHMRKLLSCPPATKRSVDELLRLLDATNESFRAFENMGRPVEEWDDWFVHILVHKLDHSTREDWETSLQDTVDFPTYKQLSSFIENRIRALEAARPNDNHQVSKAPNINSNQSFKQNNKPNKQNISVNIAQTETKTKRDPCPLCKSLHFLAYCPQFKKLKTPQRVEQVHLLNLCSNCLRRNHSIDNCPSTKNCFVCSGRHHTFLHDTLPNTSNQNVSTPASTPSGSSLQINHLSDASSCQSHKGLFATAYIKLSSFNYRSIIIKGFLDSGSERSLITERVAQALKLPKVKCDASLKGIGDSPLGSSNHKADLLVTSPKDPKFELPVQALVLKSLIHLVSRHKQDHRIWSHLKDLDLADPNYFRPDDVDCVIGLDLLGHTLLPGLRQGPFNSPTALRTVFGWIVFGNSNPSINQEEQNQPFSVLHVEERDVINDQLRLFWEMEEIPSKTFLTEEEAQVEKFFSETHDRDSMGRYVVRLPLISSPSQLGQSRDKVVTMFQTNEKRLSKNPVTKTKYNSFMEEYLSLDHMALVPENERHDPTANYVPHHVIFKSNDSSSKIRVVFNGSYRTSSGVSLNDIMHPGQRLQSDIWLIITRWRLWKYVFTADIVKMFRQIRIHPSDCNLQRIVWRSDSTQPLQDYCLTTVTYGTRSAPFLAIRVLNQLAADERDRFPFGSEMLENNIYVDDIFAGANSLEKAIKIRDELISILSSAGITLSKWAANTMSLIPDPHDQISENEKEFQLEASVSTLGLKWNPKSDQFHFTASVIESVDPTKRVVASEIAKLFDPLGWLSPFLLKAKILLQDCWLSGSDWDTKLSDNLKQGWESFIQQLSGVQLIQIPRWINTQDSQSNWELHCFSDASERAYSAALYLIDRSSTNQVQSHLLIAKTKLAPIKAISLPKLELSAAFLLAKLSDVVTSKLPLSVGSTYLWTDSQIVLAWLQGHPSRWKPFVANRVSEIHSLTKNSSWNHVASKDNPADCATRGFTPIELQQSSLWWHRPTWLLQPRETWPSSSASATTDLEVRPKFRNAEEVLVNLVHGPENLELLERVSSLTKLIRVTAYCFRFIQRSQRTVLSFEHYLTAIELKMSLVVLVRISQGCHFRQWLNLLQAGKQVPPKEPIAKFSPFLDEHGIMRVGGRLENSCLSYDEKHPIILSKQDRLAQLIVLHAHLQSLHGGQQLTLSRILRQFWIISCKTLINQVIRNCVRCARFRATSPTQLMGELPEERTNPSKPFTFTGLDYAGPYNMLPSKGRGIKSCKGYICLFVCLSSRAIHLEVVSDYETKTFIAAFKRFTSRRGTCKKIYSDNARNFVGAERELKRLFTGATKIFCHVAELLANDGTTWSFIPPQSPHFGGLWEAGIKSVKHHLRRAIGDTRLTFEEMSTVLCQIEACLNSRPLYPNSTDPNSVSAITPGHLLTGGPITAVPEPSLNDVVTHNQNRWTMLSRMRDVFWSRWSQEYLHHLQQRSKWLVENNSVKVGDVVLLKEDNLPPTKWKLARIERLHPGKDHLARVATIKTNTSTFKRAFAKLVLLPVPEPDSD